MFWDKVAGIYDFIETTYNGKVYRALGQKVAEEINAEDLVLECACGTGLCGWDVKADCQTLQGVSKHKNKTGRFNKVKIPRQLF